MHRQRLLFLTRKREIRGNRPGRRQSSWSARRTGPSRSSGYARRRSLRSGREPRSCWQRRTAKAFGPWRGDSKYRRRGRVARNPNHFCITQSRGGVTALKRTVVRRGIPIDRKDDHNFGAVRSRIRRPDRIERATGADDDHAFARAAPQNRSARWQDTPPPISRVITSQSAFSMTLSRPAGPLRRRNPW